MVRQGVGRKGSLPSRYSSLRPLTGTVEREEMTNSGSTDITKLKKRLGGVLRDKEEEREDLRWCRLDQKGTIKIRDELGKGE